VDERTVDRDYVLGTGDREIARLGVQHGAWRDVMLDCWSRAGIAEGWAVVDVGAGPGYASLDLAEIVGPTGAVTAVERSARFVEAGEACARARGASHLSYLERDLMEEGLPVAAYDAAWCRWVGSFVCSRGTLVAAIAAAVRPAGVAVFHEYADYGSWRFWPRRPVLEQYIARVMESWRAAGGEPDVGLELTSLLESHRFSVREATPKMYCVRPGEPLWTWIATFVSSNVRRMEETGVCDEDFADAVRAEFMEASRDPATSMLTPTVLEIIADRMPESADKPVANI
jgi:SAM-dependent methyltransferase